MFTNDEINSIISDIKNVSTAFKISVLLILSLIFWSFLIEPNLLITKNISIKNEDLKGIKITVASDFHLKNHDTKRLKKIIKKINKTDSDLVLLLGDYVDETAEFKTLPLKEITEILKNIKSKNGIYAVLGNHDIWLDENELTKCLKNANITVLNNANRILTINEKTLTLAGTNDYTEGKADISKALNNAKKPIILMTHNPDIFEQFVPNSVDLTISGHTHGGQIVIPFVGALIVPSDYGNKYANGLISDNNRKIYVTKGLGTTILPVRFNCLPEIVTIIFE